jgi:predicted DNA-binding transcriptional regulator
MRELLSFASEGMSVREMAHELGISRQLCLYHVKKLAADLGCVLVSAGCAANGQMMWQVWDESWLARYYAARAPRQSYIEELRHVA